MELSYIVKRGSRGKSVFPRLDFVGSTLFRRKIEKNFRVEMCSPEAKKFSDFSLMDSNSFISVWGFVFCAEMIGLSSVLT